MKIVTLLIFILIPLVSFSQQKDNDADKLLEVTKNGIIGAKKIEYDEQAKNLIIDDLIIPVTAQTHLKRKKHQGNHSVEFSLQQGTVIESKTNPDLRRAWMMLEFKSKRAGKDFIKHFKNISKG